MENDLRNTTARSTFGVGYGALSPWGKNVVDQALNETKRIPASADLSPEHEFQEREARIAQLESQVARLIEDIEDLWRELEERRLENGE